MYRLYGDNEDISLDKIKIFFNDGANRDLENDLSIVLFQDKENSAQRHEEEKKLSNDYKLMYTETNVDELIIKPSMVNVFCN